MRRRWKALVVGTLGIVLVAALGVSCVSGPPSVRYTFPDGYIGSFEVTMSPSATKLPRDGQWICVYIDKSGNARANKADFDLVSSGGFTEFKYSNGTRIPNEIESATGRKAKLNSVFSEGDSTGRESWKLTGSIFQ